MVRIQLFSSLCLYSECSNFSPMRTDRGHKAQNELLANAPTLFEPLHGIFVAPDGPVPGDPVCHLGLLGDG